MMFVATDTVQGQIEGILGFTEQHNLFFTIVTICLIERQIPELQTRQLLEELNRTVDDKGYSRSMYWILVNSNKISNSDQDIE